MSAWYAAGQQPTSDMAEGVASLLANTADCLAQAWLLGQQHGAACQDAAVCSRKPRKQAGQHHSSARSSCWGTDSCRLQQLQQHTAAVAHFSCWHQFAGLQPEAAASIVCEGRASTLTALAQRLQAAALSISSALTAGAATAGKGPGYSQGADMAAGLWLQAVMCRCAAAVSVLSTSSSDMDTADTGIPTAAATAAATHVLQAAKAYFGMAYKQIKAQSYTEQSTTAESDGPEAAASQQSISTLSSVQEHAQRVMQVVAYIVLQLPDDQQQVLRQQLESTVRGYCRLRCIAAAAGVRAGSAAAAGSQKAARSSSFQQSQRAGKPAKQGVSKQQGLLLCSALQLAADVTGEGSAGTQDCCFLPLGRLCWLEGAALAHIAGAAAVPETAAAALQLLEELVQDSTALCRDRGQGLNEAQGCMASGMLLLLLAQTGGADVSAESRVRRQSEAESMLTRACQGFVTVLQASGPAAQQNSPEAITAHMAGLSLADGRKAQQQRQGGKRKGKAVASAAAAEAVVAAGHGAQGATAAAPDATACAALCHCLLGLTLAQTAMCTGPDSDTTAAECEEESTETDASSTPAAAPAPASRSARTTGRSAAKAKGAGSSASQADCRLEASLAALTSAKQHMQDSIRLFKVYLAAQAAAGERAGSSGASSNHQAANSLWYAEEAAMAVAQAWHIAAFQDWCDCQHGFAEVLESVATQQLQEELGFLQLLPAERSCSTPQQTWLPLLLLQHGLPSCAAPEAGSSCSTGEASSCARPKCSDIGTMLAAQQPPRCLCTLQQHCQNLQAMVAESMQGQQQMGGSGWEVLQQVQVQLAAADAAAHAGDHAGAAAAAEAALLQCRAVLSATKSSAQTSSAAQSGAGGTSTARGASAGQPLAANLAAAGNACMQSHALGLYMSGLWQLSETLEAAGNPQDAVRMLKQLHNLAQSAGCHSFTVLAQAKLGTLHSRMEQSEKATAAAARAQQLHHMLQGASTAAAEPSLPSCASILTAAAVASAQGAVLLADQQMEAAQQQLQDGLSALSTHAEDAGGMEQLGWRCMQQYAQLVLQLSQCHVLLGNKQQAVAELQAAVGVLAGQEQPMCQR